MVAGQLQRRGWHLCHRRWQTPWAEVDLVFSKKERLLLVEVKCLVSLEYVSTAVCPSQKKRLQRVVENLVELKAVGQVECVLAVVLPDQRIHWFMDFLGENRAYP